MAPRKSTLEQREQDNETLHRHMAMLQSDAQELLRERFDKYKIAAGQVALRMDECGETTGNGVDAGLFLPNGDSDFGLEVSGLVGPHISGISIIEEYRQRGRTRTLAIDFSSAEGGIPTIDDFREGEAPEENIVASQNHETGQWSFSEKIRAPRRKRVLARVAALGGKLYDLKENSRDANR